MELVLPDDVELAAEVDFLQALQADAVLGRGDPVRATVDVLDQPVLVSDSDELSLLW